MIWEGRRLAAERFGVALILIWCLLLSIGVWRGVSQTLNRHTEIAAALAADSQNWTEKRATFLAVQAGEIEPPPFGDPRSPTNSVMGQSAARPVAMLPSPLAALATGPSDLSPPLIQVSLVSKFTQAPQSIDNPSNRLAGPLDLNFLATALLPLFVLALGFDALARDRDARSLPLLGSQPTSLKRIVFARLSLHAIALGLPLIVAAGFAVFSTVGFSTQVVFELTIWCLLVITYLGLWAGLTAWANLQPWSSSANALFLCGLWLASVLLLPALAQTIADTASPPPDRRAAILETRRIETDLFKRVDELREAFWAKDPSRRPEDELNEYDRYYVTNLWPRVLAADDALSPMLTQLTKERQSNSAWRAGLAWLSPTLSFRIAVERLAGIAPSQRDQLTDAARGYQHKARDHFGGKLASMTPLELADYDEKPDPTHVNLSFSDRAKSAWPAALGLLASGAFVRLYLFRKKLPND